MSLITRELFQDNYPRLYKLLNAIGMDSELSLRDELTFGLLNIMEIKAFEGDAGKMPEEDLEILATGERSQQLDIIERYGLQDLDFFLEECFDGSYQEGVFE